MNESLVYRVLQAAADCNAREFIICPGARNVSFVEALSHDKRLTTYYCPEERSAAFFALGRSLQTQRPTAVITTSGTAAAELLPAAMEAHYSGIPLILITADRPRSFRGSGAPQAVEQVGLFGCYAHFAIDIDAKDDACDLSSWDQRGPAHMNVCLEEPHRQPKFVGKSISLNPVHAPKFSFDHSRCAEIVNSFFEAVEAPLVVVSTLHPCDRESVANLLLNLNAPVFLEGISGLREDSRLQKIRIRRTEGILEAAREADYIVDGILRIGGVPTHRSIWRDLEDAQGRIKVCSLSSLPFSGISWNHCVVTAPIRELLKNYRVPKECDSGSAKIWLETEEEYQEELILLFKEEPSSEPALFYFLSCLIPPQSNVYLGNSLPIREWDLAAVNEQKYLQITASRGVNGIDGQISTFFGLSHPSKDNWAIVGDLTLLYDMAGFWIQNQLPEIQATIVVVNNGGGKIFSRMLSCREMLNEHALSFEPLAKMWGLSYQRLEKISDCSLEHGENGNGSRFLEIIPNEKATKRFWEKLAFLQKKSTVKN